MKDFLLCLFGFFVFAPFFEPLIINFIYFSNIDLFLDIILSNKNRDKIINRCYELYIKEQRSVKKWENVVLQNLIVMKN